MKKERQEGLTGQVIGVDRGLANVRRIENDKMTAKRDHGTTGPQKSNLNVI